MADTVTPTFESVSPEPAKRGPGRPKGSRNKTAPATATGTAADIRQAIATLESMYDLAAMGLMLAGLTETATAWVAATDDLKRTNEDALKAAPRLAKAIARVGSTGGSATFFLTHGVAFAGVFATARTEFAAKRAERAEAPDEPVRDNVSAFPGV